MTEQGPYPRKLVLWRANISGVLDLLLLSMMHKIKCMQPYQKPEKSGMTVEHL